MKERFDKRLADKMRAELEGLDTGYTPGAWEDFAKRKWQGGPLLARKWKYFLAGFSGAAVLFLVGFLSLSTWWMPADPQLLGDAADADSLSKASRSFTVSPIQPEQTPLQEEESPMNQSSPQLPAAPQEMEMPPVQAPVAQVLPQAAKQKPSDAETTEQTRSTTGGRPTLKALQETSLLTTSPTIPSGILPLMEKQGSQMLAEGVSIAVLPVAEGAVDETDFAQREKLIKAADKGESGLFHIGLLLSPQAVANQSSPVAFGAGIHGGMQIGRRMHVDVGLSLARQEFQPAGPRVEQRVAMALQPAGDMGFAQPNALMRVAVPQGTSLQFSQIEIPVNMRYKVLDRAAGGFFIAGGVSHMMYANQRATATFAVPNFNAQGVEAASMSETFTNTFSPDADSGRGSGQFMQLAMGYEQDLGKNTLFMIEPFYKFSLNNQTFLDQAFQLTGVNVRISYQLK